MTDSACPVPRHQPRLRWARVAVLFLMLIALAHNGLYVLRALPIDTGLSRLDLGEGELLIDGFARMDTPGETLRAADVRVGDHIRFERPLHIHRLEVRPGETFGVIIRRGEETRNVTLTAPPSQVPPLRLSALSFGLMGMLLALAGGLIAVRSRLPSGVTLGAALSSMGLVGSGTWLWENHPAVQPWLMTVFTAIMTAAPVMLLAFALLMRREAFGRPTARIWRAALWAYAGLQVLLFAVTLSWILAVRAFPLIGDDVFFLVAALASWGGFALAFAVLWLGFREAHGEDRTRFGFLIAALALLFLGGHGLGFVLNLTSNDFSFGNPVAVAMYVANAAGIVCFLYAMLRHRVVDLGFAVSRTLIYGLLSGALLLAFFFLQWGVERVIPASMRQANLLVGVGVALVLFLSFHHALAWVEKAVETLFFRRWREQERAFRRFLRQTGFVNRPDALARSTVEAMSRFADGAPTALYRLSGDAYVLEAGEVERLAERLDPDMPALVRLRAEREPIDEDAPEGVALLLPMTYRNEVVGLVAVGPRPDAEVIRPDQAELLAEAAIKVGLDLHALRVQALETEGREQRLRAEVLQNQLERLVRAESPI